MNWKDGLSHLKALAGIIHGSRAFGGPFFANVWLTNYCNLRCIHCAFFSNIIERPLPFSVRRERLKGSKLSEERHKELLQDHVRRSEADSQKTRAAIDELLKMGTRRFFFTGSGEPFLHKNILDFIGRVKNGGGSCVVYTNGTLLDHEKIDEMIKMEVDELRITTLAGTRQMYMDTHHGVRNDTFDTLRENLMYLSSQKVASGSKNPVVTLINIVISQNFKGLIEFAEFANIVRADKVFFHPLDTFNDKGLSQISLTKEQTTLVREELMKLKPYFLSKGIDHNINHFLKVFTQKLDTMELYRLISCYVGWLGIRLQINGEVNLCCRCYESLGNIFENSLQEIWYGKIYQKFRSEALEISRRKTSVEGCDCQSCPHIALNLKVNKYIHPFKNGLSKLNRFNHE